MPPDPGHEKPGAAGAADRVGFDDTPGEVRGHSMSVAAAASSLVTRWKSAMAAAADPRLSRVDLAVHLVILDHLNNATGEAWPSAETVASAIAASVRAVRKARGRLVALGHLTETTASGRPNRYRIGTPELPFTPEQVFTPEPAFRDPCTGVHPTPERPFRGPLNARSPELALKHLVEEPTKEPRKKRSSASRPADRNLDDAFVRFWNAYPRRDARSDAEKAWMQVKGATHVEAILGDLSKRAADPQQWTERQFIPMPATYLRKRRWLDEWQPTSDFRGKAPAPSPALAAEINAKADARLAKLPSVADSFEGRTYTGTPDDELPDHLRPVEVAS